jgi:hypothetical protein
VIDVEMPDTLAPPEAWTEPKGWPTPPRPFHEAWRDLDLSGPPVLDEILEMGTVVNVLCAEEPVLREGLTQVRDRLAGWRYTLSQLIELPARRTTPGGEVVEDAQHQAAIQQAQRQLEIALRDAARIRARLELIEHLRQELIGADRRPARPQPDELAALALAAQDGDEAARKEFIRREAEQRLQAELERLASLERERRQAETREREAAAGRAEAIKQLLEVRAELGSAAVDFEQQLTTLAATVVRLLRAAEAQRPLCAQHELPLAPDPVNIHRGIRERVVGAVAAAVAPGILIGWPRDAIDAATPLPERLGLVEPTEQAHRRRRGDRDGKPAA